MPRRDALRRPGASPAVSSRLPRLVHRAVALRQGHVSLGQLQGAATAKTDGEDGDGEDPGAALVVDGW